MKSTELYSHIQQYYVQYSRQKNKSVDQKWPKLYFNLLEGNPFLKDLVLLILLNTTLSPFVYSEVSHLLFLVYPYPWFRLTCIKKVTSILSLCHCLNASFLNLSYQLPCMWHTINSKQIDWITRNLKYSYVSRKRYKADARTISWQL